METIGHFSFAKKAKSQSSNSFIETQIRRYFPSLEEYIVRKTQAEKRRALFGKDPFLS